MHASFSFHHSNLQLAYTTQAWILKLKTCAIQANIWNAHSNATYKFMSLLPLLVCIFYWSPYNDISFVCSPYVNYSHISPPMSISLPLLSSHYLCIIFVHYLSLFVINDHKGLIFNRLRLSMSINGVRIIFPNLVQSRSFAKDI